MLPFGYQLIVANLFYCDLFVFLKGIVVQDMLFWFDTCFFKSRNQSSVDCNHFSCRAVFHWFADNDAMINLTRNYDVFISTLQLHEEGTGLVGDTRFLGFVHCDKNFIVRPQQQGEFSSVI